MEFEEAQGAPPRGTSPSRAREGDDAAAGDQGVAVARPSSIIKKKWLRPRTFIYYVHLFF